MEYTCYYCEHNTSSAHLVTFYKQDEERNELLCDECYADWLLALKG